MHSPAYLTVWLGSRKVATARTITPWSPLRTPLQVLLHRSAPPLALSEQQPLPGTAVRFTGPWTKSLETLASTTLIRNCSPPLPSQSLGANYEIREHLIRLHASPKKKHKPSARLPRRANAFFVAGMMVAALSSQKRIIQNDPPNAIPNSGHLRHSKTRNSPLHKEGVGCPLHTAIEGGAMAWAIQQQIGAAFDIDRTKLSEGVSRGSLKFWNQYWNYQYQQLLSKRFWHLRSSSMVQFCKKLAANRHFEAAACSSLTLGVTDHGSKLSGFEC